MWDVESGEQLNTFTGHYPVVNSVAYSPDGGTVACASWDGIRFWDPETGEHKRSFIDFGSINFVAFSPNGGRIASASWDDTVRVWNAHTGEEQLRLEGNTSMVNSVAFSFSNGRTVASASRDNTVRLWDADTGKALHTLTGHMRDLKSVAFSPDGGKLASGGWDTIFLWDVVTGEQLRKLEAHKGPIDSIAFSPGGSILASGGGKTISLWNPDKGELLRTINVPDAYSIDSLKFSPDGRTLASGGWDGMVRLWDTDTWELVTSLKGHSLWVFSLAFSPDGETLASSGYDGTVLLWDLVASAGLGVAVEPMGSVLTTLGNIKRTALLQNYPNPFNPETWIPYQLANDAHVTLNIYDQSGHFVRALDIGRQKPGVYRDKTNAAYWDGRNQNGERVTSGTYFYQFRAGDYSALRQMVILK